MGLDVDEALGAYSDTDLSVRLVRAVSAVVPYAPSLTSWYSLADGLRVMDPSARKGTLDRAIAISQEDGLQKALWVADAMDRADRGLGVIAGLHAVWKLATSEAGQRLDALETDDKQAADALIKGLAISWMAHRLTPGTAAEKLKALQETEAGRNLLFTYATVELALPFADNALLGTGRLLDGLYERFGEAQVAKLRSLAGDADADGAVGVFQRMGEAVSDLARDAGQRARPIAEAVAAAAPTAFAATDRAAGAVATAADLLPVYRFLGARLVAEVALRRALATGTAPAAAPVDPSLVPVAVTRGADDLPPQTPARKGCLGFGVALLAAFAVAAVGVLG